MESSCRSDCSCPSKRPGKPSRSTSAQTARCPEASHGFRARMFRPTHFPGSILSSDEDRAQCADVDDTCIFVLVWQVVRSGERAARNATGCATDARRAVRNLSQCDEMHASAEQQSPVVECP